MNGIIIGVTALVVTVGLLEVGLRVFARRRRLLDWGGWEIQNKVTAMDRLAKRGGASVVCIGASHAQAGIDPELLSRLLGNPRPAFNAAINGTGARTLELWTRDVILPRLRPDLVVIGFNSEWNDNSIHAKQILDKFRKSPAWLRRRGEGSLGQRLVYLLERASYLVRYRWLIRSKRRRRQRSGERAQVSDLGYLKWVENFRDWAYGYDERKEQIWRDCLHDYAAGGPEFDAVGRLVDLLRARGIDVLLVRLPFDLEDWIPLHPRGREDYERFEEVFRAFIAERDVPFFDLMPHFTSRADFADPVHLTGDGQQKLTRLLAEAVAERGRVRATQVR